MLGERLTQWVLSLSGFLLVLLNLLAGDVTRMNCCPTVNEQLCIQGLISLSKVKNSSGIQKQVTVSSGVRIRVALITGSAVDRTDKVVTPGVFSSS